ncbi:hypothetical protein GQ651_16060 [Alphaproteobacteria bacterium GH1-50]|uniref:Dolichyl-phosphate-mannose-protein mannosyltransferase n=1 Tax=Kangsaoukella pontilimi TaxID=2691042 RepID=A0A7C9J5H7_9RHOB|nr:hypothetical protein [Kangsaoukella pontilimi]MXQ09361.1 hypothetical protein [Kangsaoukella pontilimi]
MKEQATNGVIVGLGAVALGLVSLLWLYGTRYPLHHDLAGGLNTAALAVQLGPAFDSYNSYFPPSERLWYSLAVMLGAMTGVGTAGANVALTTLAVLISAGLATLIRRRTTGGAGPFFFGLSFLVLLAIPALYKNIFGLREHLVVLGLWPYLVLRAAPPEDQKIGAGLRVALGLWMGGTLLFKYFYAIVVFLIEVADALIQRRIGPLFRAENLIAAAVVALYLGLWLLADPAQRAAIGAMRSSIGANLLPFDTAFAIARPWLVAAIVAVVLARLSGAGWRIILLGLVAVLGAMAVTWLQQRWYTHHLFPILMAFIGWWWMLGARLKLWVHPIAAAAALFAIEDQYSRNNWYVARVAEVSEAIEAAGLDLDGKRVGVLTMHPSPYN